MKTEEVGIHLMLAGLALQVASIVIVLAIAGDFAWSCWRNHTAWDESYAAIRQRRYFKGFIYG
jgi:hypothetical protein